MSLIKLVGHNGLVASGQGDVTKCPICNQDVGVDAQPSPAQQQQQQQQNQDIMTVTNQPDNDMVVQQQGEQIVEPVQNNQVI